MGGVYMFRTPLGGGQNRGGFSAFFQETHELFYENYRKRTELVTIF